MKSLSARLLVLTVLFVMLAEVLIFLPSVARFRETWIADRMTSAHLALLVLESSPHGMISDETAQEILDFIGARGVAARHDDMAVSLMTSMPPAVEETVDLAAEGPLTMIAEALSALFREEERIVRIVGPSPRDPEMQLELVMDEAPLNAAILAFGYRILLLSLTISVLTAFMVFLVLRRQLVRPLKRLTWNMVRFRERPEDQSRAIRPSKRSDELGVAERELSAMQTTIREALTQRRHLAALGTAVAKINHDLRGILSSALVVSDRLESSEDPEVRRIAPGLLDAIDRAVALCTRTLNYVGRNETGLDLKAVPLAPAVESAGFGLPNGAQLSNRVASQVSVFADHDQLARMVGNLLRNAAEAGASRIEVSAEARDGNIVIEIADDGPGLPPRALDNLFKPFEGSARAGGSGLGLSIARELARDHGGDLVLERTDADGTIFVITLPAMESRPA